MTTLTNQYGCWIVEGKPFQNKLQAVTYAVPKGWWPHFDFNEQEFSQCNWNQEPVADLETLYFNRAKYLRSKYDHITIEFSGGADSWYVLYSFIAQGLHVDVVNHRYIEAAAAGDRSDTSTENTAAEGRYTAYPWFQEFQKMSPYMQWQTYGSTKNVLQGWEAGPLDPFEYNRLHVAMALRVPGLAEDPYQQNKVNGRAAVIHGIDKPNIFFQNEKFYYYFPDHAITGTPAIERSKLGCLWEDVFFYWDPDCSDLLIKQAHIIKQWFQSNPAMISLISKRDFRNNKFYDELVNQLVYPRYKNMWQAEKNSGYSVLSHEAWFHKNYLDTVAGRNWQSSMQTCSDIIHQTLKNTQFESFLQTEFHMKNFYRLPSSWSKLYDLGDICDTSFNNIEID